MKRDLATKAIKLANTIFKDMAKQERKYTPPVCQAYSGMTCIHPRYLPICEGCIIMRKKEGK